MLTAFTTNKPTASHFSTLSPVPPSVSLALAQLLSKFKAEPDSHFLLLTTHITCLFWAVVIAISLWLSPAASFSLLPYYLSSTFHRSLSSPCSSDSSSPWGSLKIRWTTGQNVPPRHKKKKKKSHCLLFKNKAAQQLHLEIVSNRGDERKMIQINIFTLTVG